ncbi:hypothetical protein PY365_31580 [Roseiarcaceae bacterium H3SJ34-1]|uniref:helix-turn-helix domain-containing protein n=1 Tax=Terripilifer ovatus TaxID=3032367 RepID=UPI003AB9704D|nr:hypothetical protein [Roseiarcaceae bacterium H3SJ34-1]
MSEPELFTRGGDAKASKLYHYTECGLDNIYLLDGFEIEEVDGEEFVSVHDVDGLWKAIGLNLVANRKTFSPTEIRFIRSQMDKTQAELASLLRVDDQTVARWEKKKCKIPGPADLALRFLFLASPVAQPEGGEALASLHKMVEKIVETDSPSSDVLHFASHDGRWEETQQRTALAV